MSVSSNRPGDWSFSGSNSGMSQFDTSAAGETPEPVEYSGPAVADQEEKAVSRSKLLFFLVLLLAVSGAATATYLLMEHEEHNDFQAAFAGLGSEVSTVAGQKVDQIFDALDSYSVFISSEVRADPNGSWPFVRISDYSLKSEKIRELVDLDNPVLITCPVVHEEDREQWPSFVLESAPLFYQESIDSEGVKFSVEELMDMTIPYLHSYNYDDNFMIKPVKVERPGPVLPNWHMYPLENPFIGMMLRSYDMLHFKETASQFQIAGVTLRPSISFTQMRDPSPGASLSDLIVGSQIMEPIVENGILVGVILLRLPWIEFFQNLNIDGLSGTIAVLRSSCDLGFNATQENEKSNNELSYKIETSAVKFLGSFDAHNPKYDGNVVSRVIVNIALDEGKLPEGVCVPNVTLDLYPTEELEATFQTSRPRLYTAIVVAIFAFTSLVFLLYDHLVGRRQRKFMARIVRQDLIVSNVFPAAIRDRLYERQQNGAQNDELLDPLSGGTGGAPLADLFLETTVMFADIVGFTAWASAREPAHVFILLETVYGTFDKHAYRHNVFKVETVGDCYVAVAGLPEPDKDHAMAVCRFARDCVKTMKNTTLKLEVSLGPDTSDLDLRVGIHSGQVTAGILRGERSRFQLFGDTMNTAARMESTSERNNIQMSQVTADLIVASGLSAWVLPRQSKISVKGKGEMQTYWLNIKAAKGMKRSKSKSGMSTLDETVEPSESSDQSSRKHSGNTADLEVVEVMSKTERLVEWNVEVLSPLLQQIIASRGGAAARSNPSLSEKEAIIGTGETVLEEFVPIIPLKRFVADDLSKRQKASSIDIGEEAKTQLRTYLANVASMYRDNPFHNFEHASHVTASVKKLLTRIVKVDSGNGLRKSTDKIDLVDMAGHSYGITSDPLTQFSVVFSAIIHDMDHPGVPNAQLVKENTRHAQIFKKSVAEQNSVERAWAMLMGKEYKALRACIYQTEDDLRRFRQLVVNTVMATDIVDKELQALRKARWESAFADKLVQDASMPNSDDCKATIVIEHLIQASDVSHTMQHWQIYKSWNEKFFMECYAAYKAGRAESDPSVNWYSGEIGFFDFYVIPLTKKLDSCGVFGVSSHEYLNYAQSNRDEWAREGEQLVKDFLAKYEAMNNKQ
eukprot:scaffold25755_cov147-Cylindrotheca_fusiformis.AAC.1